jgi:uncharacterized UBP type Zn finger protein
MPTLINNGNTCYINTVMQCLFSFVLFNRKTLKSRQSTNSILDEYKKIYAQISSASLTQVFNISSFVELLLKDGPFKRNRHEDFLECFIYIMERMPYYKLFYHTEITTLICLKCDYQNTTKRKDNPFVFIKGQECINLYNVNIKGHYLADEGYEYIEKVDLICEKCNYGKANKKIKRSKFHQYITFVIDDKKRCIIPLNLIVYGKVYYLRAIALHRGSQDSGHYTAIINKNNLWYIINDDSIQKIKRSNKNYSFVSSNAYVIFYERVFL